MAVPPDTVCLNCGSVNSVLTQDPVVKGVCCRCGYNNEAGRTATPGEAGAAAAILDAGIADLMDLLHKKGRP
jgi:hypothetical protein